MFRESANSHPKHQDKGTLWKMNISKQLIENMDGISNLCQMIGENKATRVDEITGGTNAVLLIDISIFLLVLLSWVKSIYKPKTTYSEFMGKKCRCPKSHFFPFFHFHYWLLMVLHTFLYFLFMTIVCGNCVRIVSAVCGWKYKYRTQDFGF